MMKGVTAFLVGLLFALGLGIGGMTNPDKVLGFLDLAGNWDPSLGLVMAGAVGVGLVSFRWILLRPGPVLGDSWFLPPRTGIDPRLIIGELLFGIGWGIAGFCPGPALVSLAFFKVEVVGFVAAMAGGMLLHRVLHVRTSPAPDN